MGSSNHRHSDNSHVSKISREEVEAQERAQEIFWAEAPRFEKVYWTREPYLRRLYLMAVVLMVASATTGYDGMLVNTSQLIGAWQRFFEDVRLDPNKLGILVNMFSIGSIVSFFITPYVADTYGRKPAIIAGCIFMIAGGCLTAFASSWESAFLQFPKLFAGFFFLLTSCSVHGRPLLARLWQLPCTDGFAPAPDRDLPSPASRPRHSHLQLSVECRCIA
jgi:hypothetical protein